MTLAKTKSLLNECRVHLKFVDNQLIACPHENITKELRACLKLYKPQLIEELKPKPRRMPLESVLWTPGGMAILERFLPDKRVRVQLALKGWYRTYKVDDVELLFEP